MALFPRQQRNFLNERFFLDAPNRLVDLVPAAARWQEMVRVIDTKDVLPPDRVVLLLADAGMQEAKLFVGDASLLAPPTSK
jgi:hypothetical protein